MRGDSLSICCPPKKTMKSWQENVYFVLVEPEEGGNIGASARAMANMGFHKLILINPVTLCNETYAFAHGAEEVLKSASIFSNIHDAIRGVNFVIGTSRRKGKNRGLFFTPWESVPYIYNMASKNTVAILFGRESRGLMNDESRLCSSMIYIPSDRSQPSINLSHSVMIIAYELKRFGLIQKLLSCERGSLLQYHPACVDRQHMDALLKRIENTLELLEYLPKGNSDKKKKILQNISNMLSRTGVTFYEESMIQGLCNQLIKKLNKL